MVGEWKEKSLASLIEVKHGYAFPGENIHEEPRGDILLTPGNFAIGGGFKGDKFKYFDGEVPEEFVLKEGDLLITMTDLSKQADTLGYPAFVPKSHGARFLHNQRLGKVIIRSDGELHKRFLFYMLRTAEYRNEILASATGTTVKHTSPSRILSHKTKFPPLPEQQAIACILGALDDKIELNQRMNQTLEEMARAIFKSWFVDFDQVRAKAAGQQPPGLKPEIAALFPDSFEDSELGEIPKGWEVRSFTDGIDVIGGGTPKTSNSDYWGGGILWFSVVDTPAPGEVFVIDTEKTITREGVNNSSTQVLPVGTTIISARGTVGNLALVGVPMAMNQSCYGLRDRRGELGYYLYFATDVVVKTLRQRTHGSVFDTITRDTLNGVRVVVPPDAAVNEFERIVSGPLMRVLSALHESRTLAAIRDALLRKLLSGEIVITKAERIAGRAI